MLRLRRIWSHWATVALLLAALIFLYVIARSSSFQSCYAHNEQYVQGSISGLSWLFRNAKVWVRCVGDFTEQNHGPLTAVATILLAFFTTTLWWATRKLVRHATEIERAYISCGGAREWVVKKAVVDGKTVEVHEVTNNFQFHVNNYGKTPGIVFRIRCGFCEEGVIPNSTPIYEHDVYRHSPIDPGRRSLPLAVFPVPPELKSPVVFGRVSYKTIFGNCFSSAFVYRIPSSGDVEAVRPPNKHYLQEQPEGDDSGQDETSR
jgi:hypothetical protein